MTKKVNLIIILSLCILTLSMSQERQIRDIGNSFDMIDVSDGVDIYLSQGDEVRLEVEADERIIDRVQARVQGSTLVIDVDGGSLSFRNWNIKKLAVHLTVRDLKQIEASGGSDIRGEDRLKFANLTLDLSGGSDLDLDGEFGRLQCFLTGGSDVGLQGSAGEFVVEAKGGSDIDAEDLETGDCRLTVSGGSDAYVNVTGNLWMEASGASDIYYRGNPKITYQKSSGGADITGN